MRCPTCHRRVGERCPLHPSAPVRLPTAAAPTPDVPGFGALCPLGRGGFGRVFSARREADGREVALKVLEPLASERLEREVVALREIGPPAVPALLGTTHTSQGEPVVVMERIEGLTLARHLADLPGPGVVPWTEARPLVRSLLEALERVHAAAFVHRDLKPENVMLSGGRTVLVDLGLARPGCDEETDTAAPTLTRTGQRLGTHEYMAPEQCRDARHIDARADLYSLGVICFELLSGRPPFVGDAAAVLQAHVSRRPPSLVALAAVPPEVDAFVQRLLAKAPGARFEHACAALEALSALPEMPASGATVSSPGDEAAAPGPRHLPSPGGSGPRDLALLGVRTGRDVPGLLAELTPFGAVLARMDAGLALFAFPHAATVEEGLRNALRATEALQSRLPAGSEQALHCAALRVRERAGRITVGGAALEHPERWWPPTSPLPPGEGRGEGRPATAVPLLTSEARAHLRAHHVGPTGTGRTPLPDPPPPLSPLLGRDEEQAWLHGGLARARSSGAPVLLTLLGEEGLGKTRLLTEWTHELRDTPDISLLHVEAMLDEGSASESGLRNLIVTALALPPHTPPDEAVRHLLATVAPTSNEALAHPAARRQHIARALASRLWRLASERTLVLLVDDAHTLDPTALDALELATLASVQVPLCVVLAGRHRLLGLRPYLGERARDSAQRVMAPLPDEAAGSVLRALLHPVDLVPEGVLRELVDRCGGSPLRIVETVRALRAAGALRLQPGGLGWYLATDALHGLAADSPDERLAERGLAALPSGLRALLQVAALLGNEVRQDELAATLAHLDTSEELDVSHDPGVGLERLARAGLLSPRGPGRWRFEHPSLREAIGTLLPARLRQRVCEAALRALPDTPTPRRARLAEAAGDSARALALHQALAQSARRAHRLLEAELHASAALALLPRGEDVARRELLSSRGRVRYRLQRIDDAVEDLRAARTLAEAQGDTVRTVDLMLEEATALDWQDDTEGSTALLEQALGRLGDTAPPELAARLELARARVIVRGGDAAAAVPALERAVALARGTKDVEAEAIALAMLGAMLAWTEQLNASARRFDEAIALCEATGDTLHLGAALNNRVVLRILHRDVAGAHADLERAVVLGRELGNVQIERTSAFNLAELLGYQGRAEEALPLARRAGLLSQRFFPRSMVHDALLVARLCCAVGDFAEAAHQLAWLEETGAARQLTPAGQLMTALVRQVVGEAREPRAHDAAAWERLVVEARERGTPDERLEVLVWAARAAGAAGEASVLQARLAEAEDAARTAPLWAERVQALARESAPGRVPAPVRRGSERDDAPEPAVRQAPESRRAHGRGARTRGHSD